MFSKLYNNKEFLRFSIFFVWLINISGFFGVLSDQKEFFLSTSPFAILISFILLILNYNFRQKGFFTALISIITIGFLVEFLGVNYDLFFGSYEYGNNLGYKIGGVPIIMSINWLVLIFLTGSFTEKIIPDHTIFFDLSYELAMKRFPKTKSKDWFENLSDKFFDDVYNGFLKIASSNANRIKKVDSKLPQEEVCAQIINEVSKLLK